jgi:hypothetical protein
MTSENKLKTTGQLRTMLANAAQDVLANKLELDKANTVFKLAKSISDSLYSEAKIKLLNHQIGQEITNTGELYIGDPSEAK